MTGRVLVVWMRLKLFLDSGDGRDGWMTMGDEMTLACSLQGLGFGAGVMGIVGINAWWPEAA